MLASATEGVFGVDYTTADILFLFAAIILVIVGILAIVQKSVVSGIAWIALGLVPFGLMLITP